MNTKEHLITVLMEECAEVQYECCKILRFGAGDHDPRDPEKTVNVERLRKELGQLRVAVDMLEDEGIIKPVQSSDSKRSQVEHYMHYARETGALVD